MIKRSVLLGLGLLGASYASHAYNVDFEAMPTGASYTAVPDYYPGVSVDYPNFDPMLLFQAGRVMPMSGPLLPAWGNVLGPSNTVMSVAGLQKTRIFFSEPQATVSLNIFVVPFGGNPNVQLQCFTTSSAEGMTQVTLPLIGSIGNNYGGTVTVPNSAGCIRLEVVTFANTFPTIDNIVTTGVNAGGGGTDTKFSAINNSGQASVTLASGGTVGIAATNLSGSGNLVVTSSSTPQQALPGGFSFLGTYFDVSIAPSSLTFDSAQVCFPYTDAQLTAAGLTADQIRILHYADGQWNVLATTLNAAAHQVCANVTSFSPFALGAANAVTPVPALPAPTQLLMLLALFTTGLFGISRLKANQSPPNPRR